MLTFVQRYKNLLLIGIGSLVWSITMVKSGLMYEYGMGFWGPNGHDGIWHVSLINSLAQGSLDMPIFAGEQITNYHIGFDLILAIISKITGITGVNLYFQIVPPLLAVGIGLSVYRFVKQWQNSESAALWSVFLIYFGVSFGWLINLLRVGDFGGESMFWAQQSISTLINPPFALSLILTFLGMNFLHQKKFWPAVISLALLSQIKIYAAILIFAIWIIISLLNKDKFLLKAWLVSMVISLAIYLPLNKASGSVLVWQPGWFLETMMAVSDRLSWPKFYEAMINYRASGNWVKFIAAYLIAFVIFVIGNLGNRILVFREIKLKDTWNLWSIGIISLGFLIPMIFLQNGTPWNTIQFTYYSLIFSAVLSGIALSKVNNKAIYLLVVISGLMGTWGSLQHYLPHRPPAQISRRELEALDFLKNQPPGVVMTMPFDKKQADAAVNNPPRPLYLYESTAYVSAMTGKPVYLEDEVNLNITGFDWKSRRSQLEKILSSQNAQEVRDFWETNDITYVYFLPHHSYNFGEAELGTQKIFDNGMFMIWKVN